MSPELFDTNLFRLRPSTQSLSVVHQMALALLKKRLSWFKSSAFPVLVSSELSLKEHLVFDQVWHSYKFNSQADLSCPHQEIKGHDAYEAALSFFTLQCENALLESLSHYLNLLKKGGIFLGVMAGEGAFKNLRENLFHIESQERGGISPRVAPMVRIQDLGMLLQKAGFQNSVVDSITVPLNADSYEIILKQLKQWGYSNCLGHRTPLLIRKGIMKKLMAMPAKDTIDLLFFTGFKM